MRSFSKENLSGKLADLRAGFRHAFATQTESLPYSKADEDLMARVADAIVNRDMAAPATVFLESMGPMNFLGSQALHFLTPIIECVFNVKEIEQVARLLERRETIPQLIAIIEAKSAPKGATAQ